MGAHGTSRQSAGRLPTPLSPGREGGDIEQNAFDRVWDMFDPSQTGKIQTRDFLSFVDELDHLQPHNAPPILSQDAREQAEAMCEGEDIEIGKDELMHLLESLSNKGFVSSGGQDALDAETAMDMSLQNSPSPAKMYRQRSTPLLNTRGNRFAPRRGVSQPILEHSPTLPRPVEENHNEIFSQDSIPLPSMNAPLTPPRGTFEHQTPLAHSTPQYDRYQRSMMGNSPPALSPQLDTRAFHERPKSSPMAEPGYQYFNPNYATGDVERWQKENEALLETVKKLQDADQRNNATIAGQEDSIQDLQNQIDLMRNELDKRRKNQNQSQGRNDELEKQIQVLERECETVQIALQREQACHQKTKRQLEDFQSHIEALNLQLEDKNTIIKEERKRARELMDEVNAQQAALQGADKHIRDLEKEVDKFRDLEATLNEQFDTNERLNEELEKMKRDMETVRNMSLRNAQKPQPVQSMRSPPAILASEVDQIGNGDPDAPLIDVEKEVDVEEEYKRAMYGQKKVRLVGGPGLFEPVEVQEQGVQTDRVEDKEKKSVASVFAQTEKNEVKENGVQCDIFTETAAKSRPASRAGKGGESGAETPAMNEEQYEVWSRELGVQKHLIAELMRRTKGPKGKLPPPRQRMKGAAGRGALQQRWYWEYLNQYLVDPQDPSKVYVPWTVLLLYTLCVFLVGIVFATYFLFPTIRGMSVDEFRNWGKVNALGQVIGGWKRRRWWEGRGRWVECLGWWIEEAFVADRRWPT
ncbi:hypothetical protein G7K_2919-t1 [Saitoella complicata NRRL Y-17804]|uniref:EF-hand domain-containing protein n=1 Tax=Saitoella complicata (strain BCRC 22490 / CBS 7301 / JCM 7358 / NBRC 10748 / NRRL Y-17804) TaxID=698492 RepID=A0A0E9NH66_SAICN|nr:hypothetical protein G7K_2919-t1 [Saitoella complicata NRRL Y-17804]